MTTSPPTQLALLPLGEAVDDTPARITCRTWQKSWEVPQQLISMSAGSIAKLMTDAVILDNTLVSSSCSADDQIQHAHDVLVGLASSHSAIKYWLYLRMFWLCDGRQDDGLVLEHIAHIEGFAAKGPGASQKWDRVKRGLAIMQILLNHRQALVDVVACRAVLLDQLIQLPVQYLQKLVLIDLVHRVRTSEQGEIPSKMTVKRLQEMCKVIVAPPAPSPEVEDVRGTAETLPSASRRRRRESLLEVQEEQGRGPRLRKRVEPPHLDSEVERIPTAKRRRSRSVSSRPPHSPSSSSSDEEEEKGEEKESLDEKENEEKAPISTSLAHRLHDALVAMNAVPVLTYYQGLIKQFPDLVSVAAPYTYDDAVQAEDMIHHRLQDQCASRLLLYTSEFLNDSSDCLQSLPALLVASEGGEFTCSREEKAAVHAPTKLWVFFPDETDGAEVNNSARALSVCAQFHPHLGSSPSSSLTSSSTSSSPSSSSSSSSTSKMWDEQAGRLISLPTALLLEAGVRILVVVQRAGELVAMPGSCASRYGSPCAHMVHTLPARSVLSVGGNYCSTQHLVDHIGHQWSVKADPSPPGKDLERLEIRYPEGVSPENLPPLTPIHKPNQSWLQRRYEEMSADRRCGHQAWASELQSPDQMLYLLNCQLDAQSALLPPALIMQMGRLARSAPTVEDGDTVTSLFIKAIAKAAADSSTSRHSFRSCCLRFGCGVVNERSEVALLPRGFRFSTAAHQRPLLYVRFTPSQMGRQREFACQTVGKWLAKDAAYEYNVSWPMISAPVAPAADATTKDVQDAWQERIDHWSTPFLRHHLHPVHTAYVQDIGARDDQIAALKTMLPSELVNGGALRHCQVLTDGVHRPSFYFLRSSAFALEQGLASAALSDTHNESQRLGFWHHLLPMEELGARTLPEIDPIAMKDQLQAMYKVFKNTTNLTAAADAFAKSDHDKLSNYVSTSYGELSEASVERMVDCMTRLGVRSDDVFFDVGSGYGRVVCHVALATGMTACGIEAVAARHQLAQNCVAACRALDSAAVHLYRGDVLAHLHLLLSATHVLVFDARFQPETKAILRHMWRHLAGSRLRLLLCIKAKGKGGSGSDETLDGLELVEEIDVTTGQNDFVMGLYRPKMTTAASKVEVAVFAGGRIGLRARCPIAAGTAVAKVVGQPLSGSRWDKLKADVAIPRWQWALKQRGRRIHVLSIARFVNSPEPGAEHQRNVRYVEGDEEELQLQSTRDVAAGEEIVARGEP